MLLSFYLPHPWRRMEESYQSLFKIYLQKKKSLRQRSEHDKIVSNHADSLRNGLLENSDSSVLVQCLYNLKQASC